MLRTHLSRANRRKKVLELSVLGASPAIIAKEVELSEIYIKEILRSNNRKTGDNIHLILTVVACLKKKLSIIDIVQSCKLTVNTITRIHKEAVELGILELNHE